MTQQSVPQSSREVHPSIPRYHDVTTFVAMPIDVNINVYKSKTVIHVQNGASKKWIPTLPPPLHLQ